MLASITHQTLGLLRARLNVIIDLAMQGGEGAHGTCAGRLHSAIADWEQEVKGRTTVSTPPTGDATHTVPSAANAAPPQGGMRHSVITRREGEPVDTLGRRQSRAVRYTTSGPLRDSCGHHHNNLEHALRCLARDEAICVARGAGGHTDRKIFAVGPGGHREPNHDERTAIALLQAKAPVTLLPSEDY